MLSKLELQFHAMSVVTDMLRNVSVDDVLSVVDVSTDEARQIVDMIQDDVEVSFQ